MSESLAGQFSYDGGGLFGPHELDRLLRGEFARARRYGHPLTCLSVGVDRLGALHDLYGRDAKHEIYRSVLRSLRADTRASDFIATLVDDRLLIVVPHTSVEGVRALGRRLQRGVRRLKFEGERRALDITLSIGAVSGRGDDLADVDRFVAAAGDAQLRASVLGGDRLLEGRPPSPTPAAAAPEASLAGDDVLAALAKQLRAHGGGAGLVAALFELLEEREESRRHPRPAAQAARAPSAPAVAPAAAPSDDQLETIERRISKMADILARVERQLAAVEGRPAGEGGIAALDDRVATLDALRKELMGRIFEANVDLRRQVEQRHGAPGNRPEGPPDAGSPASGVDS